MINIDLRNKNIEGTVFNGNIQEILLQLQIILKCIIVRLQCEEVKNIPLLLGKILEKALIGVGEIEE